MYNPSLEIKERELSQIDSASLTNNGGSIYFLNINLKTRFLDYRMITGREGDKDLLTIKFQGADDKGESEITLSVKADSLNHMNMFEDFNKETLTILFVPITMLEEKRAIIRL